MSNHQLNVFENLIFNQCMSSQIQPCIIYFKYFLYLDYVHELSWTKDTAHLIFIINLLWVIKNYDGTKRWNKLPLLTIIWTSQKFHSQTNRPSMDTVW